MAISRDGVVVAILNKRQVLVKVETPSAFVPGKVFTVYQLQDLPAEAAQRAGVPHVELPKGKLKCEAVQSTGDTAVLAMWTETRVVRRKRASVFTFEDLLGDVEVPEKISESARLSEDQSLSLDVGPVSVGLFAPLSLGHEFPVARLAARHPAHAWLTPQPRGPPAFS